MYLKVEKLTCALRCAAHLWVFLRDALKSEKRRNKCLVTCGVMTCCWFGNCSSKCICTLTLFFNTHSTFTLLEKIIYYHHDHFYNNVNLNVNARLKHDVNERAKNWEICISLGFYIYFIFFYFFLSEKQKMYL